jgi:ketosteroid isomerase-like protein
MKNGIAWLLGTILAFVVVTAGTANAAEPDGEVTTAADQFYKALNVMFTGDVGPMKEVWSHADDVTYMGPTGGMQLGWAEVLKNWEAQAAMKLGGKVSPEDMHIFVGREIAITQNYEKGENIKDGKTQTVSIRATNVFRKENGKWKMIGHHTDLLSFLGK